MNNPFSLDVYGDSVYWVSLQSPELRRQDKFGRGVNTTRQTNLFGVKDVKMYHRQRYNTSSQYLSLLPSTPIPPFLHTQV